MTQEYLKSILNYNEESGIFTWKKRLSNRAKINEIAGSYNGRYIIISIDCKRYRAHNLVWFYVYGKFPSMIIDHIDQNTKNNKLSNLRDISSFTNARNKPKRRDNSSGITGVSWDKITNKWVVRIKNNAGKYINRGRFASLSEAECARNTALIEFGYFINHGKELSSIPYRKK